MWAARTADPTDENLAVLLDATTADGWAGRTAGKKVAEKVVHWAALTAVHSVAPLAERTVGYSDDCLVVQMAAKKVGL